MGVMIRNLNFIDSKLPKEDRLNVYCEKCNLTMEKRRYNRELLCEICMGPLQFECPKCRHRNYSYETAQKHIRLSECGTKEFFFCSLCPYRTTFKHTLSVHINNHHSFTSETTVTTPDVFYPCSKCDRCYKRKSHMHRHQSSCGKKPHIFCSLCDYKAKRNDHLKQHMLHKHKIIT